ncbi:unnamed protein product [Blepharisma stoltei]|uniref:Uncharacterized protein n=1 Tax=Blepharisma stoltei TaxID=1481888 RepID=A0AAU9JSE7_9CILI|nr:unnamed protein product [Blepharisma stoltei]
MGAMQIKERIRLSKSKNIHVKNASKLNQKRRSVIINQPSNTDREPKLLILENNAGIRCKSSADILRTEPKPSAIFINDPVSNPIDSNYTGNYEQTIKLSNARRKSASNPVSSDFFQKIDRNNNRKPTILGKEELIYIQNGSIKSPKLDHQFVSTSTFKLFSPTANDKKTIEPKQKLEEKIVQSHRRVFSDGNAENLLFNNNEGRLVKNFVPKIPNGLKKKKRKTFHIPKTTDIHIKLKACYNKEHTQEEENFKLIQALNLKNKAENEWTWRGKHGLLNSLNS